MDFKQIQELIKLINKSNIGEVTIEENGQKLIIKQKKDPAPIFAGTQVTSMPAMAGMPMATSLPSQQVATTTAKEIASTTPSSNTIVIKSPMIGTFYRKASPDKPNFAEVGTEVSPGKVVCIIEAMKLFNEIESEVKGKIVKVLVEDASPVEFDQPLFLVEPS